MRKIFLPIMLISVSANAATMCVPDFTQMFDKCTVISYTERTWTVNCGGVEVYGIAVEDANIVAVYHVDDIKFSSGGKCLCLMQKPVVGQYFVPLFNPGLCNEWSGMSCGQFCANVFVPGCAFSKCTPSGLGLTCTQESG